MQPPQRKSSQDLTATGGIGGSTGKLQRAHSGGVVTSFMLASWARVYIKHHTIDRIIVDIYDLKFSDVPKCPR